jgi:hypothetical protein
MSILVVAIVPPHLTVLSMRMAVAFYVTGISTPEVHLESPPLLGTLTVRPGWDVHLWLPLTVVSTS